MCNTICRSGAIITSSTGRAYFGYGRRTWMEEPEKGKLCFYFPDFFLKDKKPWFTHERCQEFKLSNFIHKLPKVKPEFHPNFTLSSKDKDDFFKSLSDLQNAFENTILEKAVPYIMAQAEGVATEKNLLFLLRALLFYGVNHPLAYLYGFWEEGRGMLGATPELLFRLSDTELSTFAIAGTSTIQFRYRLLHDKKLLREHNLVVSDICEALRPYGAVKKSEISALVLPNICHLKTPVTVKLAKSVKPEAVIQALHPTAALGAFPRKEGMKWLKSYQQKIDRRRFGAPVGFFHPNGVATFYVGIRNIQWENGRTYMGAGCGVIQESQPSLEWEEIQLKLNAIKRIFSL